MGPDSRTSTPAAALIPLLTLGIPTSNTTAILRAMKEKHGPVALIHVDAHADVNPDMFGEAIAHGTPFRRAVEEGLLIGDKVWQIGLRGSGYSAEDFHWPRQQGFTIVPAHEVWWQSLAPLMAQIREKIGPDTPKYAGKDYVNPGSEILSAEMMLRHMGWKEAADLIISSMEKSIASKKVTYDFARLMDGATQVSCSGFGQVMIDNM